MRKKGVDWGPKPFRTLDAWFTHSEFIKMVKEKWRNIGNKPLLEKFIAIKGPLRRWNKKDFGCIDKRIKMLECEMETIDREPENGNIDEIAVVRRRVLLSQVEKSYNRRDSYWKQLSKSRLAKEMDKNSRYFHAIASTKGRKKSLLKLRINGDEIQSPRRIKNEARTFYKNLYK